MNKTITFLGLASISLFGFTNNLPAHANIPQASIQEILMEGEFNEVNQQLNQILNINFIYLPQIEESAIPTFNIQGAFVENSNNQINQAINQNVLDFQLIETNLVSFNLNNFLDNDNILNSKQFISQEVFIEGDSNLITQQSSQTLTDFIWLDESSNVTKQEDFIHFIDKLLVSQELDLFQFALQDTFVSGHNNIVSQTIEQTLDSFIFTNNNLAPFFDNNVTTEEIGLDIVQFTIQETFTSLDQNTLISQNINQLINDISFVDASIFSENQGHFGQNNSSTVEANNLLNFDIDAFINGILNDTNVEATQTNRQRIEIIGNENTDIQENLQILFVSVPEPSLQKMMIVLFVIIGIQSSFKKWRNRNF